MRGAKTKSEFFEALEAQDLEGAKRQIEALGMRVCEERLAQECGYHPMDLVLSGRWGAKRQAPDYARAARLAEFLLDSGCSADEEKHSRWLKSCWQGNWPCALAVAKRAQKPLSREMA